MDVINNYSKESTARKIDALRDLSNAPDNSYDMYRMFASVFDVITDDEAQQICGYVDELQSALGNLHHDLHIAYNNAGWEAESKSSREEQ
ncbi:MAG: hypothetical protein JAY75_22590 [Candidatus Thiodiazotropha taylori]|nr:hypothetical protein [Candidatus Thiodiazotropha taylori]MCG8095355.1 hypothetical protein [Candidatus Thiodiazotropha endolucinida]MCG8058396.1 hypothetical protein [Candidatus Thiodiazotropha taylori]MCG8079010.1 hypothetical protein [Candidatus Thiodiazotropha taylori]MCG8102741.1 hypothetical protein [Candidatus Thiodiazotropha taylori]